MSTLAVDNITNEVGDSTPAFPNGAPAQSGQVAFFAMDTAPTGWLKANGAAVSRTTYSALFDAIGTTFGAGDGSTTFELPDLRGEFPRGWDDGRGVDSGRSFGTAQLDQMQRITGSTGAGADNGIAHVDETPFPNQFGALDFNGNADIRQFASGTSAARDIGSVEFDSANSPNARTSSSTDGETRSRNVAMLFCIKF